MREEHFRKDYMDFSVSLLKDNCEEGKDMLISPLSVLTALGMAAEGSAGTTEEEFEKTLASKTGLSTYLDQLSQMNISFEEGGQESSLKTADAIWVNDLLNYQLKPGYADRVREKYHGEIKAGPFNEKTAAEINAWVLDRTDGMIPEIIGSLGEDAQSVLVNAVNFKDQWETPYEDTDIAEDGVFRTEDGGTEKAVFLHSEESQYLKTEASEGFIKPYQSGRFAFFALRPADGKDVKDLLEELSGDACAKCLDEAEECIVLAGIPEYSVDYDTELSSSLKKMGLAGAFSGGDFSNMTEPGNLNIGQVLHKTHIEVDRQGTKAAASTAIEMVMGAAMPETEEKIRSVLLDKPFLYGILDTEYKVPVFLGIAEHVNFV